MRKLKINVYDLHKIINKLDYLTEDKSIDSTSIKDVKKMMIDATSFTIAQETIEIEVKVSILETHGERKPDASRLENTKKMSAFNFTDVHYVRLKDDFNSIAKKRNPEARITTDSVRNCKTVNDCIKLVVTASKVAL